MCINLKALDNSNGTKIRSESKGIFFPHDATAVSGTGLPDHRGFTIILRHTTLGRTPLGK